VSAPDGGRARAPAAGDAIDRAAGNPALQAISVARLVTSRSRAMLWALAAGVGVFTARRL
jgi:hypothetical protein